MHRHPPSAYPVIRRQVSNVEVACRSTLPLVDSSTGAPIGPPSPITGPSVHLPGGSPKIGPPKKGLIRSIRIFFRNCSLTCRVLKLRFFTFSRGPGGFRELREAGRNHFHLSWYLLVPGVTSYDRKTNKEKSNRLKHIFL